MSNLGNAPSSGEFTILDTIVPNGASAYSLTKNSVAQSTYRAEQLLVSVNGSIQAAGNSYTVSGSVITFSEALTSNDSIDFILALGNMNDGLTVNDATITAAKLASDIALTTTPVRINSNQINSDITIGANQNAMVIGPIAINAEIIVNGSFTVV
jgi:hypothetical protein